MPKKSKEKALAKSHLKEAKKDKQSSKANRKTKKNNDTEFDEEDIDQIIARLDSQEKSLKEITPGRLISLNTKPYPRIHCTWTNLPNGEILMFGGESTYDQRARVYDESFLWNPEKNEWRKIELYLKPKPRCSHQAILYKDDLIIFGGEYSTSYQFYHFNDMWKLNLKSYTWEEIKYTGTPPSPRSGHRMVLWKKHIVLFGGFHSKFRETRYFNDLYIYSLQNCFWRKIDFNATTQFIPEPRAGCLFASSAQENYILLYGGHHVQDNGRIARGKELQDCWVLDLKPLIGSINTNPIWEKIKRVGNFPSSRSGFSTVYFKNMVLLFGGVTDEDDGGINFESVFHNDLYAFDFTKKKWYFFDVKNPLNMDKKDISNKTLKTDESMQVQVEDEPIECSMISQAQSQKEFFNNFDCEDKAIEKQKGHKALQNSAIHLANTEKPENIYRPTSLVAPLPRIKGNLSVQGNSLYLHGGLIELKKKIVYLNDCWTINLIKRDKWECVEISDMNLAVIDDNDSSSDSHNEDMDDMDSDASSDYFQSEDESDLSEEEEILDDLLSKSEDSILLDKKNAKLSRKDLINTLILELKLDDPLQTPKLDESLRKFFLRTKSYWASHLEAQNGHSKQDKEFSRSAFELCENRYNKLLRYKKTLDYIENKQRESESNNIV